MTKLYTSVVQLCLRTFMMTTLLASGGAALPLSAAAAAATSPTTSNPEALRAPIAAPVKEWTILTFLNGNNNLDPYGEMNLNQMEQVGSSDQVNVVVQWASQSKNSNVRLYIKKDTDTKRVTSPVVERLGKVDMGNWKSLVDFIQWGVKNYPAKHYFINVWDHGSGWHDIQLQGFRPQDISHDDRTGNFMTTQQLGMAMAEAARIIGHKVDIYASDACLMGMVDVAGQMRDSVQLYLGSQELEPGAGWPYDAILRQIQNSDLAPKTVGRIVAEEYLKSYQGGQNGSDEVTFSAFDLSESDAFYAALRELREHLARIDARNDALQAAGKAQYFFYPDYVDLMDFVRLLNQNPKLRLDSRVLTRLQESYERYVFVNQRTSSYAKASGVSVWLPDNRKRFERYLNQYRELQFESEVRWTDGLANLVAGSSP